jgi:tetratricopeptide (TPR) repeat protein
LFADDPVVRYYTCLVKVYASTGEAEIAALVAALAILRDERPISPELHLDEEMIRLEMQLGIAYFLGGNYSAACTAYEVALALAQEIGSASLPIVLYNYASNLMRLADYATANRLLRDNQSMFLQSPKLYYRLLGMLGMSYCFLGDGPAAIACVQNEIGGRPDHENHYFRYILMIGYALRGDLDLATTEAHNLRQVLHYKPNPISGPYISFFCRYFDNRDKPITPGTQHPLLRLQQDIATWASTQPAETADYHPLRWLRDQLANFG